VSSGRRLTIVLTLFVLGLGLSFALQRGAMSARPTTEGRERPADGRLPQRVVTLAPSMTELVFALGAGDRVVAVGDFCFHPPEATARPRAGGEFNPNLEHVLALKPDLIVLQGEAEKVAAFARRYGIRVLRLPMDDLAQIYDSIATLGGALGARPEAERLVARLRLELATVAHRVAGRRRAKVFLCTGHRPGSLRALGSTGGHTFLSEILAVAGGDNILADVRIPYPMVAKEDLVGRAPDVILELRPPNAPGDGLADATRRQLLADWQRLPSLPAVRDGRIHILTDDFLLIPGSRMGRLAERLAKALHPDAEGSHHGR